MLDKTYGKSYTVEPVRSYKLEEFVCEYPLPQLVSVTEGHYGLTEDFSMSEGTELILFFKKKTQAVIAIAECETDPYHIPLNCSLQFSPYQSNCKEHLTKSYYYKTVEDLIQRSDGLPKVVKVLKSYKGSNYYMVQGELIFPITISGQGKKRVLEYMNGSKKQMQAKLSCAAGFSTNPSDTKMYLIEYVEHINKFPGSVLVFCDKERGEALSHIHTGTEFTLQECKTLHSCICSTDVHGELGYPLLEILTAMPIEVKITQSSAVSMNAIYDTVKTVYSSFKLSMVTSSMFLAQDSDENFYEEIRKDDGTLHIYDLERPEIAFGTVSKTGNSKKLVPPKLHFPLKSPIAIRPVATTPPPLPPRSSSENAFSQNTWPRRKPDNKGKKSILPSKHNLYFQRSPPSTSPDENRTYLRSLSVSDILRVLDNVNLAQYRDAFQINQVDGKTLLSYTTVDLIELGVTTDLYQKLLLDIISGNYKLNDLFS